MGACTKNENIRRIRMKNKCRFVFNNGNLAILCSGCSVIIKEGKDFSEEEKLACSGKGYLPKQYCNNCKK